MSDCTVNTNLSDTKRSPKTQSCDTCNTPIGRKNKRIKRGIKKFSNHVTFALEDVYINGCTPYVSGITDSEVIRLYHNDIWYSVSFKQFQILFYFIDVECFEI